MEPVSVLLGLLLTAGIITTGYYGVQNELNNRDRPIEMNGCGRLRGYKIEGSNGHIASPRSTESPNYPDGSFCEWEITVPQGKKAHLHVEMFSLEEEESCQYDYLEVFDLTYSGWTKLDRYCGNNILPDITATSNVISIQFKSDSTGRHKGFRITYSAKDECGPKQTPAGCGTSRPALLEGAQGHISSPTCALINKYPGDSFCQWRITVPQGKRARLHVGRFSLEASDSCQYDHLEVYDGAGNSSIKLGRYCGNNITSDITATSNVIFIQFRSDQEVTESGFRITFLAKEAGEQECGIPQIDPRYPRIIDGFEARPHSWPWQVSFTSPSGSKCGGSILSKRHIITAAHCIYRARSASQYTVKVGKHNLALKESTEQVIRMAAITVHKNFSVGTMDNDIAILHLAEDIRYTAQVMPICLPRGDAPTGMSCITTGWGFTTNGALYQSQVLNQVRVPIVDRKMCPDWYGKRFTSSKICAGYPNGSKDTCQGDSGGPLVCEENGVFRLHGITSDGGPNCGAQPSIYTRVTQFVDWVNATISEPKCGIPQIPPKFPRIVGGIEATPHSWPWQVSLTSTRGQRQTILTSLEGHFCGGSILSKRYVITAAHCVEGRSRNDFRIVAGEHNSMTIENTEQVIGVANIILHENFTLAIYGNDIAILHLAEDIRYTPQVKPICMPRRDAATGTKCITTGWGVTQGTGNERVLNQVLVPILSRSLCSSPNWHNNRITDSMICAGYPQGGRDSCQRDSGGPLVSRQNDVYRLHGITSWGDGCARPNKPGVYTRVARFVDWVDAKTSGAFQLAPP